MATEMQCSGREGTLVLTEFEEHSLLCDLIRAKWYM
jgi:hypothetical protein